MPQVFVFVPLLFLLLLSSYLREPAPSYAAGSTSQTSSRSASVGTDLWSSLTKSSGEDLRQEQRFHTKLHQVQGHLNGSSASSESSLQRSRLVLPQRGRLRCPHSWSTSAREFPASSCSGNGSVLHRKGPECLPLWKDRHQNPKRRPKVLLSPCPVDLATPPPPSSVRTWQDDLLHCSTYPV